MLIVHYLCYRPRWVSYADSTLPLLQAKVSILC